MSKYVNWDDEDSDDYYEKLMEEASKPVPLHILQRAEKIQKVLRRIVAWVTIPPLIAAFLGLLWVIWTGGHGGWIIGVGAALGVFLLFCLYDSYVLTPIHQAKRNGTIDE